MITPEGIDAVAQGLIDGKAVHFDDAQWTTEDIFKLHDKLWEKLGEEVSLG